MSFTKSLYKYADMKKRFVPKIIFLFFLWTLSTVSYAQLGLTTGIDVSNVRHNDLLPNQHSIILGFMGPSFQYRPFHHLQQFSFIAELLYNVKGYKQTFERDYLTHFHYFSLPVLLNYDITNRLSVHGGTELSVLVETNNKKSSELYNQLDVGLNIGIGLLMHKNFQLFARYNYGLLPVLDYYKMDEAGNMSPIEDIRNQNLMIGLKVIFKQ